MAELMRAEAQKIVGNRWVAGFLLWIFPIGALGFSVVLVLIALISPSARNELSQNSILWTEEMVTMWSIPSNVLGRMLLLGLTAVVFAGEYQWGTWKNVAPRSGRGRLILTKFLVLGLLVVIAFAAMSLIWGLGQILLAAVAGSDLGPAVNGRVLRTFAGDYALQASLAFTSVVIGAGYVALAAMFMRSILGGVLVGLGITVAEPVSFLGLLGIARLLDVPQIYHIFRLTPFYNLDNVSTWVRYNTASSFGMTFREFGSAYVFSDSLAYSLVVLALWVFALVGLNVVLFRRQDITS